MNPSIVFPLASAVDPWVYLWKPAGLPVFPPHEGGGPSVLSWWLAQDDCPREGFPEGFEGGIAHRLDTATSGLLLAARTPEALSELRGLFASRSLRKYYLFRSDVGPGQGAGTVEVAIGHHPKSRRRMIVAHPPHRACRGRWYPAWTRFTPLSEDDSGCLWQAEIRTGVMHQIRVHAQHAGIPLTGDPLYGSAGVSPGPADPASGFMLHHAMVIFPGGAHSPVARLPSGDLPALAIGADDGLV